MGKYKESRIKYKPDKIKFLLVAESPPPNPENYFYFENMSRGDGFYLEIMNALYGSDRFAPKYLRENKATFLNCFRRDGFYLIDACNQPINSKKRSLKEELIRESLPDLKTRLSGLIYPETKIILIVTTVHRVCFQELKTSGFNVINEQPIPFPGNGQQKKFRERFISLLKINGWESHECIPNK